MDPFSITVAALSLAKICGTVGWELNKFIQDGPLVGTAVVALQSDVKDFETILELLRDTVNNDDIKAWVASNGSIATFWQGLPASLKDAEVILQALEATVARINKSTSFLENKRKQIRLKFAADEIAMYRQQISGFKGTIQVILNTTTILHQVSDKQVPNEVVPRLDETQNMIRTLGIQFNERLAVLQTMISSQAQPSNNGTRSIPEALEYQRLDNLRNCLRGAASVITSASTIRSHHNPNESPVVDGSDFGDVFPVSPSDLTLNWIRERGMPEQEEQRTTRNDADQGGLFQQPNPPEEPDFDLELELQMMQACYQQGLRFQKDNKLKEAEYHFQLCIDSSTNSSGPSHNDKTISTLTMDAITALVPILDRQEKWPEVEVLLRKKLSLKSRAPTENHISQSVDKLYFAKVLLYCGKYEEALLYGRSAEADVRGPEEGNVQERVNALTLIAQIYGKMGRQREADRCTALVQHLRASQNVEEAPIEIGTMSLVGTSLTGNTSHDSHPAHELEGSQVTARDRQGPELEGRPTELNQVEEDEVKPLRRVGQDEVVDNGSRGTIMDQLKASMEATSAALQANLAAGEADRQTSRQMSLDAKRVALREALMQTSINGGKSFKAAAGA